MDLNKSLMKSFDPNHLDDLDKKIQINIKINLKII